MINKEIVIRDIDDLLMEMNEINKRLQAQYIKFQQIKKEVEND